MHLGIPLLWRVCSLGNRLFVTFSLSGLHAVEACGFHKPNLVTSNKVGQWKNRPLQRRGTVAILVFLRVDSFCAGKVAISVCVESTDVKETRFLLRCVWTYLLAEWVAKIWSFSCWEWVDKKQTFSVSVRCPSCPLPDGYRPMQPHSCRLPTPGAGNLFRFACRNRLNQWQNSSACQPKFVVRGLNLAPLWQRTPQLGDMECDWYGSVLAIWHQKHMRVKLNNGLLTNENEETDNLKREYLVSEASLTCWIEVLACQVRHASQGLPTPGLHSTLP